MPPTFSTSSFHKGQHLKKDEVYYAGGYCPICLSKAERRGKILLQTHPDIYLLRCINCKGYSASSMPTDDALTRYYASYYHPSDDKITFHGVSRLAKHIRANIDESLFLESKKIRILDFGGGNGSLALSLASSIREEHPNFLEVILVDHNVEKSFSQDRISFCSYKELAEVEGTFSIILASAVLEHVPNLNTVVHQLVRKLQPSGYFYARTPYTLPFKQFFPFLDFTYPGHVHDLGPAFWNHFAQTFSLPWSTVLSQTSPVQTQLKDAFLRTLISTFCKMPSRIEQKIFGNILTKPIWPFVGGWEALFTAKPSR